MKENQRVKRFEALEKNQISHSNGNMLTNGIVMSCMNNPEVQSKISKKYNRSPIGNLKIQLDGIKSKMNMIITNSQSPTRNFTVVSPKNHNNQQREILTCKNCEKNLKQKAQENKKFQARIRKLESENKMLREINDRHLQNNHEIYTQIEPEFQTKRQSIIEQKLSRAILSINKQVFQLSSNEFQKILKNQSQQKLNSVKQINFKVPIDKIDCGAQAKVQTNDSKYMIDEIQALKKTSARLTNNIIICQNMNSNYCGLINEYNLEIIKLRIRQSNQKYEKQIVIT